VFCFSLSVDCVYQLTPTPSSVQALPSGELGGCLGSWAKGNAKMDQNTTVWLRKLRTWTKEKKMKRIKANGSHVHAVY